jgi:hypothetical protein
MNIRFSLALLMAVCAGLNGLRKVSANMADEQPSKRTVVMRRGTGGQTVLPSSPAVGYSAFELFQAEISE